MLSICRRNSNSREIIVQLSSSSSSFTHKHPLFSFHFPLEDVLFSTVIAQLNFLLLSFNLSLLSLPPSLPLPFPLPWPFGPSIVTKRSILQCSGHHCHHHHLSILSIITPFAPTLPGSLYLYLWPSSSSHLFCLRQ